MLDQLFGVVFLASLALMGVSWIWCWFLTEDLKNVRSDT